MEAPGYPGAFFFAWPNEFFPPVWWWCVASTTSWRVLLLRVYNYWDCPKGVVEPGEDPLAAARREVREETTHRRSRVPLGRGVHRNRAVFARTRWRGTTSARTDDRDDRTTRESGARQARAPRIALVRIRRGGNSSCVTGCRTVLRWARTCVDLTSAGSAPLKLRVPRRPPRRKSSMLSASSSTARCRASNAAQAMCGVTSRFGMPGSNSGLPSTGGSCGSTSIAAPPRSPPLERRDQRVEIDQRAARGVDEQRLGLHQRELARADQARGRGRERAMQRQHVRGAQHLIERDAHRAELDVLASASRPGGAPGRSATSTRMPSASRAALATARPSVP